MEATINVAEERLVNQVDRISFPRDTGDQTNGEEAGAMEAEALETRGTTSADLLASTTSSTLDAPPPPPLLLTLSSKKQNKKELRRAQRSEAFALKKKQLSSAKAAKSREKAAEVRSAVAAMTDEELRAWQRLREERREQRRVADREKKERLGKVLEASLIVDEGSEGSDDDEEKPQQPVLRVVIDCGFSDGMMTMNEVRSLASQLARCVGSNAKVARPALLAFAGIPSPRREGGGGRGATAAAAAAASPPYSEASKMIAERISRSTGCDRWPVLWLPSLEGFLVENNSNNKNNNSASRNDDDDKKKTTTLKIVYLSADAEEELGESLDSRALYVVGGLVDRNRHRGAAAERARRLGGDSSSSASSSSSCIVSTARLPLKTLGRAELNSSGVLTVDQTFKLLVEAVNGAAEGGKEGGEQEERKGMGLLLRADWEAGVKAAVPLRKLASKKQGEDGDDGRDVVEVAVPGGVK